MNRGRQNGIDIFPKLNVSTTLFFPNHCQNFILKDDFAEESVNDVRKYKRLWTF